MATTGAARGCWRGLVVVLAVGVLAAGQARAHAQEATAPPHSPDPWLEPPAPAPSLWVTRPLVVELHAGLGTPVGYGGVMVDYSVAEWLAFEGGLGVGTGAPDQRTAHLALGTRLRLSGGARERFYFGVYYSTGSWMRPFFPIGYTGLGGPPRRPYAERVHWLMPDIGYDFRFDSGIALRIYGGYALALASSELGCRYGTEGTGEPCELDADDRDDTSFPFVGMSLGVAPGGSDGPAPEPPARKRRSRF